jgi:elongator complex protein 5
MHLATAILRMSNLCQTIEKKKARDRSLQEPVFGSDEGREGVLIGIKGQAPVGMEGVVLDMEIRRKSGRAVRETFVLSTSAATSMSADGVPRAELGGKLSLLDDHPLYAPPIISDLSITDTGGDGNGEDEVETTFSLGLTEKQRRDREGVVLPYFDAQKGEGSGEGGRILYEMDRGDDFDEEEDEI